MEPESDNTRQTAEGEPLTPRQKRFLRVFGALGTILRAARSSKIHRDTHYAWMRDNATYRQAFAEAQKECARMLEDEAVRRAVQGENRAVRYKGRVVGYENTKSDGLLQFLLKANAPDKFGDKSSVKLSNPDGSQILGVHDIRAIIHSAALEVSQAATEMATE